WRTSPSTLSWKPRRTSWKSCTRCARSSASRAEPVSDLIFIDGSQGEGGGQVLRASLTLSLVTGQPFRIDNVRGRRKKPGLLRQHLTAVRAAAQMSNAAVSGDQLGSSTLAFRPDRLRGGAHHIAVGSAGSACLVLQTLLPALALAGEPSHI